MHGAPAPIHQDVATGDGQVFLADGLGDVVEADEHGFRPKVVDFDLHFFGVHPSDLGLVDLLDVLDALLQDFGVVFQLVDGVVPRKIDLHDRDELGEVEVEDVGVAGQVVWKAGVAHGDVHLVLDLSQCHFWCYGEVELDVDGAVALLARRDDLVDARDALEFFLNRSGDEFLNVAGAVAGIGGAYKDLGNDDFWEAFLRDGDVGRDTGDQDDHDQDRHGGAVFDRGGTQAEFLGCLGIHRGGRLGVAWKTAV